MAVSRTASCSRRFAGLGLVFSWFSLSAGAGWAQDDTALARDVYADVNKRLGSMRKVETLAQRPGVSYKSEVKAWIDEGAVRKLQATERDDSGDVVTDYYFLNGSLVFVYRAVMGYAGAGTRQVTRGEDRFYFRDGRMFKWLGGQEKAANAPQSRDFAQEAASLSRATTAFLAAVGKVSSAPAGAGSAPAEKVATGIFLGIEQGDYFYFRLRTGAGEESFMVLRETGGLAAFTQNTKSYVGKKVNLRWVERFENIPEAGGRTKVRVAVGAELAK